jgi:GNAT superfamily N-acetyltransferase
MRAREESIAMAAPVQDPGEGLDIGILRPDEHDAALDVLVKAMHTNPICLAAAGGDQAESARVLHRLFGAGLRHLGWDRHMLVARSDDGRVLGVCGMLPPGECQPSPVQKLRIVPALLPANPRTLGRVLTWVGAWSKVDTETPHWHLGPVSVDPDLQGQGVGTALMRAFCDKMDAEGTAAWLETDRGSNVPFYQRFGFEVAHEQDILGVPNWFMLRPAPASDS